MSGCYLAAIALAVVAPEYPVIIYSLLASALILTLGFGLKYRVLIIQFFRTNLFRQMVSEFTGLFLIFCILGVINYLVFKNDFVKDITSHKIHTLSNQSIKAMKSFEDKKVSFKIFAKREEWGRFTSLLELYRNAHHSLDIEAIDIQQDPALVAIYGVKESGTLVIEVDGDRFKTIAKNELAITNLLLKISNPNKLKLYQVVGHNELSLSDKNVIGGNFLKEKIESSSFEIQPLELTSPIPSDANAILILNPQIDYLEEEIKKLKKYISNGGALFITLSPQFNGNMLIKFSDFLTHLGVRLVNGIVLDRLATQQGSQPSIPVITNYGVHKILENFEGRTLFPLTTFFEVLVEAPYKLSPLVGTAPFPASWGEVDFEQVKSGRSNYDEGFDYKGPLSIFLAGEYEDSRIIISGSTAFVSNQFQGQSNNFNLFLNALSWVVKEEALVSLDRPQLKGNIIYISDIHVSLIFYFAILIFPFLFFIMAIFSYRKRLSR